MQTPYQQLAVAVPAASAADAACCPCCVEPACCSRVGSCPCFCTGSTASFSIALSMMWLALPVLATALFFDIWDVSSDSYGMQAQFGMWSFCTSNEYYDECDNYDSDTVNQLFWGAVDFFNAMRSLAVIGTAFTLIAGILGAMRLARQQRSKPNSTTLNSMTAVSGWLAFVSSALAFGFAFPLAGEVNGNLNIATRGAMDPTSSFGTGWVMMIVGIGMLAVGVPMHTIAQCCYSRTVAAAEQKEPSMYGAGYLTAPSVFTHPQPAQHSVAAPSVYCPTASAVHYPQPQYVQAPMRHIYQ